MHPKVEWKDEPWMVNGRFWAMRGVDVATEILMFVSTISESGMGYLFRKHEDLGSDQQRERYESTLTNMHSRYERRETCRGRGGRVLESDIWRI